MGVRAYRNDPGLGRSCAFEHDGCKERPAYSVIGPLVVPERVVKGNPAAKQQRVPVALAFACKEHLFSALEWMPEAEVASFDELPPAVLPQFMDHVFGGQLREVAFTA